MKPDKHDPPTVPTGVPNAVPASPPFTPSFNAPQSIALAQSAIFLRRLPLLPPVTIDNSSLFKVLNFKLHFS